MSVRKARVIRAVSLFVLVLAANASRLQAQSQVRVAENRTMIWRRDARIVATTIDRGTVLDVTGREGDWYVVVIPSAAGTTELGLIAVSQVEPVAGASRPAASASANSARSLVASQSGASRTSVPAGARHPIELFGFGQAGYTGFFAHDTFDAVLGRSGGAIFGGGGEVRFPKFFIAASVERFQKTGERVFVNDGQVFKLGIADTVRVIPIAVTIGYRLHDRNPTPYFGGGAGSYLYREQSDFADASENVNDHFTSYHALAGLEFVATPWLRWAVEAQVTTVPKALGGSGVAGQFDDRDLGGFQVRVKLLAGR